MKDYQDINAETIDRWVKEGWQWGTPISHEEFEEARKGNWDVHLTTIRYVPHAWFPENMKGKKILGLASGGGQQMPVFAALGADVTLLDYSSRQCDSDRMVAEREGYAINIIQGDMTKPFPFADESFDLIFHPVSNCYIEKVEPVFKECSRVLRKGGSLLGGYDIGVNYLFDMQEEKLVFPLPFNPLVNPAERRFLEADDSGVQFSHTLEEQLGGQLKAGLVITDLFEDYNTEGRLSHFNIPAFLAVKAVKPLK